MHTKHTNDALHPVITRYGHAVQSAGNGQYRVRSATFWLSLGRDRGSTADVAYVRQQFEGHGIDGSTPTGDLGRETPDAWVVLTAVSTTARRVASIDALPDALFGDVPDPIGSLPDASMPDQESTASTPAAMTSTDAPSPVAGLNQPPMTTSSTGTLPTTETYGSGSSDSAEWVTCPSCGATVLLSALFCPLCDRPRTHVREQVRQRAASTGEPYAVVLDRVRAEGRPLPAAQRQRLHLRREASVIIGIIVLAVGARFGEMLMPILVAGALVALGVSVVKPDILDMLTDRRASRQGLRFADGTLMQIAIVVAVIVAMYLLAPGTAIFGMRGGIGFP